VVGRNPGFFKLHGRVLQRNGNRSDACQVQEIQGMINQEKQELFFQLLESRSIRVKHNHVYVLNKITGQYKAPAPSSIRRGKTMDYILFSGGNRAGVRLFVEVPLPEVMYLAQHGPQHPANEIVFKDGNPKNYALENLELRALSRKKPLSKDQKKRLKAKKRAKKLHIAPDLPWTYSPSIKAEIIRLYTSTKSINKTSILTAIPLSQIRTFLAENGFITPPLPSNPV
jgi:hypothetical protein